MGRASSFTQFTDSNANLFQKRCHRQTETNVKPGIRVPCVPGGSVVKNPPASAGDTEMQGRSLGGEDPLEEEMAAHSTILAGRIP